MLARLQRLVTFGWLACAALWAAYWWNQGRPVVGAVGALAILCAHAAVLALEFVLVAYVNRNDPTPRAGPSRLLRAWWGETLTTPQVFCWRQPFRSNRLADHLPADGQGRRGVLLVHGFVCNRGLWNPWMQRLLAKRVPYIAVNLEPVFGSIDTYPPIVESAVQRLEQATGRPPLIVAHSMGGLAARAWLDRYGADARASRVITIAAPHGGTWLARFGLTCNARQMRRDSPWLQQLVRRETTSRYAKFICYYSHCDNIVVPASTATLREADNRHVPGVAHVDLVNQEKIWLEVLAELQDGGSAPTTTIDVRQPTHATRDPWPNRLRS